ncbi:uncharacterized protein B0T23DRAFT_18277 [Neurospora hispaniola]|uniref:Uncharacterized protein n=1 Tax=Neurospora hispaniola TaxID=588809 RepID=A0AAJ0IFK9_9PEZI|nr:hypothetical protein B0T23DRAFT_18277 [Neurospora hispaniola]
MWRMQNYPGVTRVVLWRSPRSQLIIFKIKNILNLPGHLIAHSDVVALPCLSAWQVLSRTFWRKGLDNSGARRVNCLAPFRGWQESPAQWRSTAARMMTCINDSPVVVTKLK